MSRTASAIALAGAALLLLSACSPSAPTPSPTATSTTTVIAPSSPSATPTAASPTPSTSPTPTSAVPAGTEPNRPAGQCADDALQVTFGKGEGAAGTGYVPVVFTNTGSRSCVLRGSPGVSVVGDGDGDGTQLGKPAERDQSAAQDVRLDAHGGQAHATLALVDFSAGDGAPLTGCTPKRGDGYRVYPPHSTRAFFVRDSGALACDPGPAFMRVGVVASGASGSK